MKTEASSIVNMKKKSALVCLPSISKLKRIVSSHIIHLAQLNDLLRSWFSPINMSGVHKHSEHDIIGSTNLCNIYSMFAHFKLLRAFHLNSNIYSCEENLYMVDVDWWYFSCKAENSVLFIAIRFMLQIC